MKLVIQRVNRASVSVDEKIVGKIEKGLFILVGFKKGDTEKSCDELAQKVFKLRVMPDQNDKMNLSVEAADASILIVSQFTLYASVKDGNRPSFIDAEEPVRAQQLYDDFIYKLKSRFENVQTGKFGEYMKIEATLDGPVTILLES